MPDDLAKDRPSYILRCHRCAAVTVITEAEYVVCEIMGWPRCCGEFMSLEPSERKGKSSGQ